MHKHASRKQSGSQHRAASVHRSRHQDPPYRQTIAPPPHSASSTPAASPSAFLQRYSVKVLPNALVIVEAGEKIFDTAALIYPCTPKSSIDASLALAFCLPKTNVGDKGIYTAIIRSKVYEVIKLKVVLKIEPNEERPCLSFFATTSGRHVQAHFTANLYLGTTIPLHSFPSAPLSRSLAHFLSPRREVSTAHWSANLRRCTNSFNTLPLIDKQS